MKPAAAICVLAVIAMLALSARANSVSPFGSNTSPAANTPQTANSPAIVLGDANGDGVVTGADYVIFKKHLGQAVSGLASEGDFDGSGVVDWADLHILLAGFEQPAPSPPVAEAAPIPEPLTMGLFFMGMLAVGDRVRRRLKTSQQ